MQREIDPCGSNVKDILSFLTHLFHKNLGYSSINYAKSAILAIRSKKLREDDKMLLNKFLKGTFNKRPMFPKYYYTWDPKLVLDLLQKWSNTNISLKLLTFKIAMWLMLLSARRGQSKIDIDIQNIYLTNSDVMITLFISYVPPYKRVTKNSIQVD